MQRRRRMPSPTSFWSLSYLCTYLPQRETTLHRAHMYIYRKTDANRAFYSIFIILFHAFLFSLIFNAFLNPRHYFLPYTLGWVQASCVLVLHLFFPLVTSCLPPSHFIIWLVSMGKRSEASVRNEEKESLLLDAHNPHTAEPGKCI